MKAGIDSPVKSILLRVDVHLCIESHIFVLYPADANEFVAYFVRDGYSDCPKLFHWRRTTIHLDVPVTFRLYDPPPFDNSVYPVQGSTGAETPGGGEDHRTRGASDDDHGADFPCTLYASCFRVLIQRLATPCSVVFNAFMRAHAAPSRRRL